MIDIKYWRLNGRYIAYVRDDYGRPTIAFGLTRWGARRALLRTLDVIDELN